MVPVNPPPLQPPPRWIRGGTTANRLMWKERKKKVLLDKICFCRAGFRGTGKMFKNLSMSLPFFFPLSCQFICGAGGRIASAHCLHSWIYAAGVRPQHQQMYCVSIHVETCTLWPQKRFVRCSWMSQPMRNGGAGPRYGGYFLAFC